MAHRRLNLNGGAGLGAGFGGVLGDFSFAFGNLGGGGGFQVPRPTLPRLPSTVQISRPPPPLLVVPPPPTIAAVGILGDIVRNVVGGITGGPIRDINAQPQSGLGGVLGNIANEFILRQTTSREQRAVAGISLPVTASVFSAGPVLPAAIALPRIRLPGTSADVGGLESIFDLALANLGLPSTLQPIGGQQQVAAHLSLVNGACPTGPQSFPAGTCLLDHQWEDAGGPRGFEMIGRNPDGRAILRKRGRRRRRRGLTNSQMTQVSWACNLPPNCRKEVLHGIVHG